jgi:magnesium-protoporphyrin O-methyltransferase
MADCCSGGGCPLYDREFDAKSARKELSALRTKGPPGMTVELIDALSEGGIDGATVLDIGAGVGAVHLALLERGADAATDVDASAPYLAAARDESERRGLAGRVRYVAGDFTAAAGDLEPADLVALDRVVCCYDDVVGLVSAAAGLARRRIGFVYPVDRWWTRGVIRIVNLWARLTRDPFRVFIHPTAVVDGLVREAGFAPTRARHGLIWQLAVYERPVVVSSGSG